MRLTNGFSSVQADRIRLMRHLTLGESNGLYR